MIYDVTGIILTPGNFGEDCDGNGMNGKECCCDECDYLICCTSVCDCEQCGDEKCPRKQGESDLINSKG